MIVGAGDIGQLIALKLLRHPEYGINVLGFVDAMPKERRAGLGDLTILGQPADLHELVKTLDVDRVIIAFSNDGHDETVELIRTLSEIDVRVDVVPRLFMLLGRNTGVHNVEGLPLMAVPRPTFPSSTLAHQAHNRRSALVGGLAPARAAVRSNRRDDQARFARAGLLQANADGRRRQDIQALQVPHDDCRR